MRKRIKVKRVGSESGPVRTSKENVGLHSLGAECVENINC